MSVSLLKYNTLGLDQSCQELINVESVEQLIIQCQRLQALNQALLVLGGGSNVVLTTDFAGSVLRMNTKGIEVEQQADGVTLTVQAGENWHQLVEYCLQQGFYGLENLALIPGSVGAAPIQNIGAYGVEFGQFCTQVEYLDRTSFKLNRLDNQQCQFGYRDSIFKQALMGKAIITAVRLFIPANWQPNLSYGPLKHLSADTVSAVQVFDHVCQTRKAKLPDPNVMGNVGSFFKNPIITAAKFALLKQQYPNIVGYPQDKGDIKVAAGWLIEHAHLKGYKLGNAGVHDKQALVLINLGHARGEDICRLAKYVMQVVETTFAITLEAEPRVMGSQAEVALV
ncbi:UDP-N-acetylmuramate dehydrogenase [Shewanella intestini]|uniref:UDP-N-acetylenolpyruvoylglucosamine reductase n=1 Tax=Shewanella intestini TaxID=2017544 RepID=A0ABS5I5K2_9GAMM|nr:MULTISPECIES: UDP-N-acetylmuramate dehydrogenase [Shewanella]MBR9728650.1 UDP-N-acetylmuramate dehydrogenase [Shewanella intestini]MRG37294.1 UDP-N-acetylmuramate dehydrogenase [Shewanella sp. XMDDZSB0408]